MMRHGGFSITELMVVVAIVAILLGIGAPSYRYITNSYRMSAEVNGLLGDLQYARAEAIREGRTVTACVSNNGTSCTGDGGNWAKGWIVFSDPATVLRVQGAFTGTTPDTFIAADSNGTAITAITYNREGFATTVAGFPNTTITLHEQTSNAAYTRCLRVTAVGMLTTETPSNNPSGTCS
ncbi:MAG: prepilin-type N-terminal cleavage/methylation domain-containing protein [Gammaproteobacteria bacterium]|nr:MAG: prepilin-type N-terminal cleavage/methylation domain-containing protein [Gammaproteobacteria bacterium]